MCLRESFVELQGAPRGGAGVGGIASTGRSAS